MKHTISRRRTLVLAGGALATPMLASGLARAGHEITHGFDDQGRQYDAASIDGGKGAEWIFRRLLCGV